MTDRTMKKPTFVAPRKWRSGNFNFRNQISLWSADTDKHVLIVLAELVNTYQNTGEMIKFFLSFSKRDSIHEEIVGGAKARLDKEASVKTLEKKLADLSRVSKLLTAVILSCL